MSMRSILLSALLVWLIPGGISFGDPVGTTGETKKNILYFSNSAGFEHSTVRSVDGRPFGHYDEYWKDPDNRQFVLQLIRCALGEIDVDLRPDIDRVTPGADILQYCPPYVMCSILAPIIYFNMETDL